MMYLGNQAVGVATNIIPKSVGTGNIKGIIGHGQEYIVTDIYPNSAQALNFDFKLDGAATYKHCIGVNYSNNIGIRMQAGSDATTITLKTWNGASYRISTSDIIGKRQIYSFYGDALFINNTVINDTIIIANQPLSFFSGYYNDKLENNLYGIGTFYGTRIVSLDNPVIVYDLVPWLENNEVCIKDTITNKIYRNNGTGAFGYIDLNDIVHDN